MPTYLTEGLQGCPQNQLMLLTFNDGPLCTAVDTSLTSIDGVYKSISVALSINETYSSL